MLSFKIAFRFLKNKKGQTLLIALAVALGIGIQIFLGLLIKNLGDDLINNTIGSTSHITVKEKDNEVIKNGDELLDKVKRTDGKIEVAIESLDRPGLISNENKSTAVLIRGFNIEAANSIYKFKDNLVEGKVPKGDKEIAIGNILAADLGVKVGDSVSLLTPDNEIVDLKVTGLLDLKVEGLNKSYVLSDINSLRNIYGLSNNEVTAIETQVGNKDIFKVQDISEKLKGKIESGLLVGNWIETNQSLLAGIQGQASSGNTIQVFIVLSVLVAIASILAINVLQKTKQIGILKAMGITDKSASLIFIFQGVLIGIFGAIIGSALGITIFKVFTSVVKNSNGESIVSGTISGEFIIISVLIAIVACVVSSIVPAIKTLKLNPVEAIKN